MKAGFIGLGNLGKAMASRLVQEGVDLIVWNRTPSKAEGLGAKTAKTPSDVANAATVIYLNLFDTEAVASVLSKGAGLLGGECAGRIVIDTTTNHFRGVEQFHGLLKSCGGFYLEAPVIGSVVPASQGNLSVLVSGERGAFDSALPYLQLIGKNIYFLGTQGLATKMKLINNLVLASFMATIGEATALGEDIGMEREKVLEILSVGAGNSLVLNAKREKLLRDDYSPQFSSAAMHKDLQYLADLSNTIRRPLVTAGAVAELFAKMVAKGEGDRDFSAVCAMMREG
jgi:3-hydroxyisobutyrate dehydrogenase